MTAWTLDWIGMLTFLGALGCGVVGGVFFAFSTFVMPALRRLPAPQGIAAMQAINDAAITPLFMLALFGTGLACVALAAAALFGASSPGDGYALAGSLLYVLGNIAVTMAFNVPRNDALAAVDAASAEGAALWSSYLTGWTAWNHARALTAVAAAGLLTVALCASRVVDPS